MKIRSLLPLVLLLTLLPTPFAHAVELVHTTLKHFVPDPSYPLAGLIRGIDGSLYGTTLGGGSADRGTVFKINPDGSGFTTLYAFSSANSDGQSPNAALVQDSQGTLFGTTRNGGGAGRGTVFKINPDGSGFTTLYAFSSANSDGSNPEASLVQGSQGSLFGTTVSGGSADRGTVFKINPDGSGFTTLYAFSSVNSDGRNPQAALVQDSQGSLFGTTVSGGSADRGTVFKINPDGSGFTTLYAFSSANSDGQYPFAALVQDSQGTLFGTTQNGGSAGGGTVFKINPDGSGFTTLYAFSGASGDGHNPNAALSIGKTNAL